MCANFQHFCNDILFFPEPFTYLSYWWNCWMNPSLFFSSNQMSPSPTTSRSISAMTYPWSLPISTWMTSSIGTSQATVLLIAGNRAKVVNFGVSKLSKLHPHITPLTQCPGTVVYMPPEALLNPAVFSEKLDIFSTGLICSGSDHDPKFPWPRPSNNCLWKPHVSTNAGIHCAGICICGLAILHRSLLRIAMIAQSFILSHHDVSLVPNQW